MYIHVYTYVFLYIHVIYVYVYIYVLCVYIYISAYSQLFGTISDAMAFTNSYRLCTLGFPPWLPTHPLRSQGSHSTGFGWDLQAGPCALKGDIGEELPYLRGVYEVDMEPQCGSAFRVRSRIP